jgi:hypothetical protein
MNLFAPDLHPGKPALRRRILLQPGAGAVRGEVEDDFHHFVVTLFHDGFRITRVTTAALRHPWTTCPAAGVLLAARLVGVSLDAIVGFDSPFSHCTHMLDLALLAAAHARDGSPMLYSMFVSDPGTGPRVAQLWRDDSILLDWLLDGDRVASGPGEGRNLRQLRRWLPEFPVHLHEPALALRRVVFISAGRQFDYEARNNASELAAQSGVCFSFQPIRAADALPMRGSKLDFTADRSGPLARWFGPDQQLLPLGEEV